MKLSIRIVTKILSCCLVLMMFGATGCNVPDDYNAEDAIAVSYVSPKAALTRSGRCGSGPACTNTNVHCGNGHAWVEGAKCYICPVGQTVGVPDPPSPAYCSGGGIIEEDTVQLAPGYQSTDSRDGSSAPTRKVTGGR